MKWGLGLVAAALWLVPGVLGSGCRSTGDAVRLEGGRAGRGPGVLIHDVRSEYSHIRVREVGSVRTLYFVEPPGLEVRQTAIDLDRPHHLLVPYPRFLFASLTLRVPEDRVLIVGLGGGAMVHFLHRHFPGVAVDAVEIDPEVVRLADVVFGVRTGGKTRIFTEDAFAFLGRTGERYEIIFMDAFLEPGEATDAKGVPRRLKTLAFLRSLHDRLVPGGVVAWNLVENDDTAEDLRTLEEAFPTVHVFRVPGTDNLAVIASLEERRRSPDELQARARELDRRMELGFPLAEVVETLVVR